MDFTRCFCSGSSGSGSDAGLFADLCFATIAVSNLSPEVADVA